MSRTITLSAKQYDLLSSIMGWLGDEAHADPAWLDRFETTDHELDWLIHDLNPEARTLSGDARTVELQDGSTLAVDITDDGETEGDRSRDVPSIGLIRDGYVAVELTWNEAYALSSHLNVVTRIAEHG